MELWAYIRTNFGLNAGLEFVAQSVAVTTGGSIL